MVRVIQCWDDGVVNDIHLIEILKKYNAKATFNLNPGFMKPERIPSCWVGVNNPRWSYHGYHGGKVGQRELVDVYGDFQVASHCWNHECAGDVPDEVFLKAAVDAKKYLEDLFQRECPGFAWPCGKFTESTMKLLREAGFVYGRTCRNTDNVAGCRDTMMLASSCHFQDWNFARLYEEAKAKNGIFYFWGHSYEMYEYAPLWQQTEEKIRMISQDPEAVWCDVAEIAKEITAAQQSSL